MTSEELNQYGDKIWTTTSGPYVVLPPNKLKICVGNPKDLMMAYPNIMEHANNLFKNTTKLSRRDIFDNAIMTILGYSYAEGIEAIVLDLPILDKHFERNYGVIW